MVGLGQFPCYCVCVGIFFCSIGRFPAACVDYLGLRQASKLGAPCCRLQKTISLPAYPRGCHVVTRELLRELPELQQFEVGLANFFSESPGVALVVCVERESLF
jgi:hypothetical protein